MLEMEEADAQIEADRAGARRRIVEWMQCAGDFRGEGLLGSGLGGSLTLIGTAWHQGIDVEAEEEGETHPHLRLIEHVLNETDWRVPLSGGLACNRLFPAIAVNRCLSRHEETLIDSETFQRLIHARNRLRDIAPPEAHEVLMRAVEDSVDESSVIESILGE